MDLTDLIKLAQRTELQKLSVKWSNEDAAWVESLANFTATQEENKSYSSTKTFLSEADEGISSLKYLCKLAGSILPVAFIPTKTPDQKEEPNHVYDPFVNAMDSAVVRCILKYVYQFIVTLSFPLGNSEVEAFGYLYSI